MLEILGFKLREKFKGKLMHYGSLIWIRNFIARWRIFLLRNFEK